MSKLITIVDQAGQTTHLDPSIVSIARVIDRRDHSSWVEGGDELPFYILVNIFRDEGSRRNLFGSSAESYSLIMNFSDRDVAEKACQDIVTAQHQESPVSKLDPERMYSEFRNGVKEAFMERMKSPSYLHTFGELLVKAVKDGTKEALQTKV